MALLKPIKPKTKAKSAAEAEKRIKRVYADAGYKTLQRYKQTTKTWKHQPVFSVKTTRAGVEVGTPDEIYTWVDKGTKGPYTIEARRASRLAFGPSSPKTRPGVIGSGAGSRGPRNTFRRRVRHPGIKARNFTTIIADEAEADLLKDIDKVLKDL